MQIEEIFDPPAYSDEDFLIIYYYIFDYQLSIIILYVSLVKGRVFIPATFLLCIMCVKIV